MDASYVPNQPLPAADPLFDKPAGDGSSPPERPSGSADHPDDRPASSSTASFLLLQFFVVPLILVGVCVSIYFGTRWLTSERMDEYDYLQVVRKGSAQRRWQAAYQLSDLVTQRPELREDRVFIKQILAAFEDASGNDEPRVRQFLALVIGRLGSQTATPALLEAVSDPDSGTRINAILALGMLGDPAALDLLIIQTEDADPGIRKAATYALGAFSDAASRDRILPALEARVLDRAADVRWNAALALARLDSSAGLPTLHRMLDRTHLEETQAAAAPRIGPTRRETLATDVLINALRAISRLEDTSARDRVARLAEEDPAQKVRTAARQALEVLDTAGSPDRLGPPDRRGPPATIPSAE